MTVDKVDIAAVRLCETRGLFPAETELAQSGLTAEDYSQRLRRLGEQGVLRSLGAMLVVPPLLGGDWVWAAVLASADRPLGVANVLVRKLPFVAEVITNVSLPAMTGPNLALLFYSRDFETEARFIASVPGMKYHEVLRVAEYSFPVALPLSREERALLRHLIQKPSFCPADVSSALGKDSDWVRAKLDRLAWTESNRSGVLRIQPEIDWSRVENAGHFHFLLETGHKPSQLVNAVSSQGFEVVLRGRRYRDRYVQVEADVFGLADLMARVSALDQIAGIRVAAIIWNERATVVRDWAPGLLE